ncbi:hypothetical protein QBC46DRAFT_388064 [Diplogelasinospora grovesii]|uniref:Uncharacterized protein n=1 Tax=Diplogelasinospora grovesii TaxID=303347 RepID=A0AAN6N6D0_9PEZI|nr:hypothetical protein QBC46DRAFT_388064 [Diplogelasinospora grovesii]
MNQNGIVPQPRAVGANDGDLPLLVKQFGAASGPIFQVFKYQGGWERWLQIEFTRKIAYDRPGVLCEQHIWGNGNRVDIWARGNVGMPHVGFELKCRTAAEEGIAFADRFHADIVKVAKRPAEENTPCVLYAIGLTTDEEDLAQAYVPVRDPNGPIGQSLVINYTQVVQGLWMLYVAVPHYHA